MTTIFLCHFCLPLKKILKKNNTVILFLLLIHAHVLFIHKLYLRYIPWYHTLYRYLDIFQVSTLPPGPQILLHTPILHHNLTRDPPLSFFMALCIRQNKNPLQHALHLQLSQHSLIHLLLISQPELHYGGLYFQLQQSKLFNRF